MRRLPTILLFAVLVVFALKAGAAAADHPPTSAPSTDCFALSPEEFEHYEPANHLIEFDRVDQRLLSAAIMHETNRYRVENKLRPLSHMDELDQAALMHANDMSAKSYLAHEEKDNPKLRDPIDRIRSTGLKPMLAAENIATTFGIQYQGGRKAFPLRQWGRDGLSYTEDGPAIPRHTYRSFAAALVEQWMKSPHHRENILLPDARYLGSACVPAQPSNDETTNEFHKFYCAQEFFTPKPR